MLSPQIEILSKRQIPSLDTETTNENKAIRLSSGLGWGLYWTPYGKAFFKGGHGEGWRHYGVCFDKAGTGMLIMTNSSNGEGIYKEMLETVLRDIYEPVAWQGFTPSSQVPSRPPLTQHKELTLNPKTIDQIVGTYRLNPNIALSITRNGTRVFVQENDEPKQELGAENERNFFSKTSDDEYSFELDSQGKASTMMLHSDGKDIRIKREQ